ETRRTSDSSLILEPLLSYAAEKIFALSMKIISLKGALITIPVASIRSKGLVALSPATQGPTRLME
ncbi:MAG: hypothetical protein ACLP9D_15515, partial [Candidatus Bathyarchaeia archaeon]